MRLSVPVASTNAQTIIQVRRITPPSQIGSGSISSRSVIRLSCWTADLTGRRYRENRDTTTVVEGTKDKETTFTESWTMALDGNDTTPWRLVSSNGRS